MLRSFPLPHLGQVSPAERPDAVRSSCVPAIVPLQLPLAQKAQPHRSHRVLSGGPAVHASRCFWMSMNALRIVGIDARTLFASLVFRHRWVAICQSLGRAGRGHRILPKSGL